MAFLQLEAEILQLASFCTAAACVADEAASTASIAAASSFCGIRLCFCCSLPTTALLLLFLSAVAVSLCFPLGSRLSLHSCQQLLLFSATAAFFFFFSIFRFSSQLSPFSSFKAASQQLFFSFFY
ncbi:hypothetical protein M9H77_29405 [Catharanthus roseus]|uniref:Uncharacterized protein n=1 Tax=Catharanthus roseus TaxID=4058 RepID=A0ACB9ZWH9_CATRO|nr:hypothetical protein M9H77_29405 [Catharanthus roseus]